MADLSGVLRKTIDGLPRATPQMREKVYEKARAAIQRQIGAANPPLAENVVAARLAALEDAIARTEEHYVSQAEAGQAGASGEAAASAPTPQPAAPPAEQKPAAAAPPAQPPAALPARPQPAAAGQAAARPPQRPAEQPAQGPAQATGDARQPAPPAQRPAPAPAPQPEKAGPAPQPRPQAPPPKADAPGPAAPQQRPAEGVATPSPRPQQQPQQARPTLPAATMPGQAPSPAAAPADSRSEPAAPFFPPETEEPDAGDPPALGAPFIVPDERREAEAGPPTHDQATRDHPQGEAYDGDDDVRVPQDIRLDDSDIPEADVSAPRYSARRSSRSSGRSGKIAAAAVVVLLLGAAGTTGWLYRDDIEAFLVAPADIGTIAERSDTETPPAADATDPAEGESVREAATAEPEPASTRRFTQRLMPDGTEVDEGPAQKTPNAFDEGTNVAAATVVDPNASPADATPTISSEIGEDPAVVGADGAVPGVVTPEDGAAPDAAGEDEGAAAAPSDAPADPAAGSTAGLAVAQKAVFYQERTEDLPGTQETGTVVWSLVEEPASDGQASEPAVRAVVEVPEEKVKMTMTIKRNADSTLPASHVIELEFDVPPDFAGRSVANVQRLALKETEQARGEPLIGVAGKISDNYFIIALNNLDQAVQNNMSLLENQKWIDIPIAYQSGRRALISVEKGIPGERVVNDALKAWQTKT